MTYLLPIPIILCLGKSISIRLYDDWSNIEIIVLAIVGCISTSPGIPNIFLISLGDGAKGLRIGYYGKHSSIAETPLALTLMLSSGICAGFDEIRCMPTAGLSVEKASSRLGIGSKSIQLLFTLQNNIFLPLPTIAGAAYIISACALGIYKRTEKRMTGTPRETKLMSSSRLILMISSWTSAALMIAASWALTMSTRALQVVSQRVDGRSQYHPGVTLEVLQWITAGLACVYAWGIGVMVRSRGAHAELPPVIPLKTSPARRLAPPPPTQRNPFHFR